MPLLSCRHKGGLGYLFWSVVETMAPQVLLRLAGCHAAEQEQTDEVGDGHEGVHAVGYVPDDVEVDDATEEQGHNEEDAVEAVDAASLDVVHRTLAVVAPAEDGAEGEGEDADGEQRRADVGNLAEGHLRQGGAVGIADVGVGEDAADEHQAGEGADDDGVPEGAGAADQRLAHGVARLGCCRHDGCAAHAALVAEQSAGNAVAGGHHHRAAHEAAACCRRVEGRVDDELHGRPDEGGVHDEDDDAPYDIEHGHEGHEHRAHLGDGLHTAQDDDSGEHTDADADEPRRHTKRLVGQQGDAVCLHRAPDAKRGEGSEDGKQDGQPLHVEATLEGVHRAAIHATVAALYTVFHGQQTLGILRRHAEDAGQPAPQHGARAAQRHGRGHAHDVSRADGGSQRRGQSAKLTDVARGLLVFLHRQTDARQQLSLRHPQAEGQKEVGAQEQHYHWPAPQPRAERREEIIDWFHCVCDPVIVCACKGTNNFEQISYVFALFCTKVATICSQSAPVSSLPVGLM